MLVFHHQEDFPEPLRGGVLTIGNFDGVHLGHQAIFDRVKVEAAQRDVPKVVCTFEPHPVLVLAPQKTHHLLQPLEEKIAAIRTCGIDILLVLPFNREFAAQTPECFVTSIFLETVRPSVVFVGQDFCYGVNRSGDVSTLARSGHIHGFNVEAIPQVTYEGEGVSSSRIRRLIREGNVAKAATLLTRPYLIRGKVMEGEKRGRMLGFPTANLSPDKQVLPLPGVYATTVEIAPGSLHPAATYVGRKPTFGGVGQLVESFLLDGTHNLYGKELRVFFHDFIRGEMQFDGEKALSEQIKKDVREIRERFVVSG